MEDKLKNYFKVQYENKKIGHAYLICNCDLSSIKEELSFCISKYFFEENINLENNEDIYIISPENGVITKEKINELHEKVSVTSQTHNLKIYIINECEKMNQSASNSLLKLLEEPEGNIVAFLITNSVDNVIKTIYSRCQILRFYNEDISDKAINSLDDDDFESISYFINKLETKKEKAIAYSSDILKKDREREWYKNFFLICMLYYRAAIDLKIGKNNSFYIKDSKTIDLIEEKNSKEELIRKLLLTNNYINYVDRNYNLNLLIDRYIIEVAGEYYE